MSDFSYMPAIGSLGLGEQQEGGGMPWESTVTAEPSSDGVIRGTATIDVGGKGVRHAQTNAIASAVSKFGKLDWRSIAAVGGVIALGGLAYWVYRTKFAGKGRGKKKRRGRRRR